MKAKLSVATASAVLLLAVAGTPADAQSTQGSGSTTPANTQAQAKPVDNKQIYQDAWLASRIIDKPVLGREGEKIGEIHDIVVGQDGKIRSVLIEGGGFLDIGDTHFAVPWKKVKVSAAFDRIQVPIAKDNLEEYSMFGRTGAGGENDFVPTPKGWRVERLMDSFVMLRDRAGYGEVEDVAFNSEGEVLAIIAEPSYGYVGPYAFPYRYGWYNPAFGIYGVPYGVADLGAWDRFDYALLDVGNYPVVSLDD